jgi:ribosomal protein S18 acetylase RimI-like enzyme
MLNQIIADIKKRNAQRAFLTVSPLNTGALILYLKFGFKIYDFRKDVYGPGSDRAYLQLKLNQSKA